MPYRFAPPVLALLAIGLVAVMAIGLSSGHARAQGIPPGVASAINDMGDFCSSNGARNSPQRRSCCQGACIQNIPSINANGEVGSKKQVHQDWLNACMDRCPRR